MADEKVTLELELQINKLKQDFDKVNQQVSQFEEKFKKSSKGAASAWNVFKGVLSANVVVAALNGAFNAAKQFFNFMVGGAVDAAIVQQNALNDLATQMQITGSFTNEAFQDMQNFASEMQRTSTVGDEASLKMLSFAKAMGASNDQAKLLTQAAIELSAATGKSTDESIRQVSKTLGGFAGELGEVNPKIKELTAEQLKNGAAAQILIDQYGGSAAGKLNTYEGALTQMKNTFGDMQERIGEIVTKSPIGILIIQKLSDAFAALGDFIYKSQPAIQDFIKNGLLNIIQAAEWVIKNALEPIASYIGIVKNVWATQVDAMQLAFWTMGTAISGIALGIVQTINALVSSLPESLQPEGWVQGLTEAEAALEGFTARAVEGVTTNVDSIKEQFKGIYSSLVDDDIQEETKEKFLGFLTGLEEDVKNTTTSIKTTRIEGEADANKGVEKEKTGWFGKMLGLDKKWGEAEGKTEEERDKNKIANFKSTMSTISGLMSSNNKTLFRIGQAAAISQATIDGFAAVQKALGSAPPPFNFALAAIVGAATAANIGNIASAQPPKFAQGGVVPGTSTNGDNVLARLNSNEVVLNGRQQANVLFGLANGGGAGGSEVLLQIRDLLSERQQINNFMDGQEINDQLSELNSRVLAA